ncbi:amidase family protein, partial [Micromonospora zhanjiangensis]
TGGPDGAGPPGRAHGTLTVAVNAKVVTTELNIGLGSGCGNPYFPHIDPAGSSTGSGVAVAAGICDLSLATDVLGSARWPAGRCGVVGLRTTHDERLLDGIFPLSPSMDAPGWIARTPDDLAFLWSLLGLPQAVDGGRRLRLGLVQEVLDDDAEPEVLAGLEVAVRGLADAGHEVRPVRIGAAWLYRGAAWELCAREAWDGYQVWRRWLGDDLSESTRLALAAGRTVTDRRYAEIRAAQARGRAAVAGWFTAQQVDAWLLPLDPDLPRARDAAPPAKTIPTADQDDYARDIGYTPVASFLGLPAITLPVGRTDDDAPLAMQLVGPPHSEATLVRLAGDLAAAVGDLKLVPR